MKKSLLFFICISLLVICFSACNSKSNISSEPSIADIPDDTSVLESSMNSSNDLNELSDGTSAESSETELSIEAIEDSNNSLTSSSERAYDKLNNNERELADAFFKGLGYFKNPASVRLVYAHSNNSLNTKEWDISVIAQNSFGGNTETDLELKEDGTMTTPLVNHVRIPNESKYRLELLNQAISEYTSDKYAL